MDIHEIASMLVNELKATVEEVVKAHGIRGWGQLIPTVVMRVEAVREAGQGLSGPDKKQVAVTVLNQLINLPIVPEFVEEKIFSLAVDWFVHFFNRSHGHTWAGVKLPF